MTIHEIKKTPFAKWLLKQGRKDASFHLWQCLTAGSPDNLAWDLLEATRGTKELYGNQVREAVAEMLSALAAA